MHNFNELSQKSQSRMRLLKVPKGQKGQKGHDIFETVKPSNRHDIFWMVAHVEGRIRPGNNLVITTCIV